MKNKRISKNNLLTAIKVIGISLAVIFALGLIGSMFTGNSGSGGGGVRVPSVNRPSSTTTESNKNDVTEPTVPDVPDDTDEPSDSATESESSAPDVPDAPVALSMKSPATVENFDTYVSPDNLKTILDVELNGKKLSSGVGSSEILEEANGTPYLRIYGDGTSTEAFAYVKDLQNNSYYGRYLVFAYRLPETSATTAFDVYATSFEDVPAGQGDYFSVKATNDNEWHVVIVDMYEAIKNQKSVLDGTYTCQFVNENSTFHVYRLRFDFFNAVTPTNEYIDVAYIGLKRYYNFNFDPDYTGAEFDAEFFANTYPNIATLKSDNGMPYVTITDTTNASYEKSVTLVLSDTITPNVERYIGILYRNAPGGKVEFLCSSDDKTWLEYSLSSHTYDISDGWKLAIVELSNKYTPGVCRRLRFDYFNGLSANTEYSIDIAFVKSFSSSAEAYIYCQSYANMYGIELT